MRRLGYPDDRAYVKPWGSTTDPVGTIIAVHVGDTACLIATIRPEDVQVSVKGRNSEFDFSCLQPRTH